MKMEFMDACGAILNSAYFVDPPEDEEETRWEEEEALREALGEVDSPDDLTGKEKNSWDAALESITAAANDQEGADRIGDAGGVVISREAYKNRDPDKDTGELLALAILQAAAQGDQAAADALGKLARTPEKVHEALGEGSVQLRDASAGGRKVKPSPFEKPEKS